MSRASWTPHDPIWTQVWRASQAQGWRYVAAQARTRLLGPLWEDLTLIEFTIPLGPNRGLELVRTKMPVRVEQLPPGEPMALRPLASRGRYHDYVAFARQGFRCYLARVEGEPAGYIWVARSDYRNLQTGITFPVGPREAYLVYSHTLRAWRGRGIHAVLQHIAYSQLQTEGVEAIRSIVTDDNRSSLRTLARWGGVPVRRIRYARRLWQRRVVTERLERDPAILIALIGRVPRQLNRLAGRDTMKEESGHAHAA